MSPNYPLIRTISEIPLAPGVHAHLVIALDAEGAPENGRDGVMKYVSAHDDSVESERVIRSPHSCQSDADTIDEVRQILRLHAPAARAPRWAVHLSDAPWQRLPGAPFW
jgi:hypothetical protein